MKVVVTVEISNVHVCECKLIKTFTTKYICILSALGKGKVNSEHKTSGPSD